MKQLNLTLVDGRIISFNPIQIKEMHPIFNEDLDANTRIVLNDGKEWCVMEAIERIDEMINL